MAIARIKKIRILAHNSIKEQLVLFLQEKGRVEIVGVKEQAAGGKIIAPGGILDKELQRLSSVLDFISAYEPKGGAVESLLKKRPLIKRGELSNIVKNFDYAGVCAEAERISTRIREINAELAKLAVDFVQVKAWLPLDAAFEELSPSKETLCNIGTIPHKGFETLSQQLKEQKLPFCAEEIAQTTAAKYVFLIYLKTDGSKISNLLRECNFSYAFFPSLKGTPRQVLNRIQTTIDGLREERRRLEENIHWLLRDKYRLMAAYDYYLNQKRRLDIEREFLNTQSTLLVEGWIPLKEIESLSRGLEGKFKDIYIETLEPLPGEDVPTVLENKSPVEPFETVVDLYGKPLYSGMDPTPCMAPFFALFFGVCLTDAAYGVIIMSGALFALWRMKLGIAGRKFVKLFFYGGLGALLAGALTGGWFADIIDKAGALAFLRPIRNSMMLFDPLKDPLKFLIIALVLGFLHISFGVALKIFKDFNARNFKTAFLLDIPALAIQASLTAVVAASFGVLPKTIIPFLGAVLCVSAASVIIYQWLINKGLTMKLFWSVFGLYGIVAGNFLADTLSYSRLFALGLATGLMAMAVNEISQMLLKVPYAGILLGSLLFIGGHAFNIAINVLGGYVHTSRLQYLEFFGKFFEAGGRTFKPFKTQARYTVLAEEV
ncbi:MAG: V-type ATPase 116kDa subunit family protein [Candidatus Omnitrophota bacterium]